MNEPKLETSKWLPPLIGKLTKEVEASQAAHARELKRKYLESEQRGFESGLEKAKKQFETMNKEEKASLQNLLNKLAVPLHELEESVANELKNLVQSVLVRLTYHAYERDPDLVFKVVEEGIAALPAQSKEIILRLHPDDAKRVQALLNTNESHAFKQLFVVEDAQLKVGDVIFKTKDSELNATLEERLNKMIACLWRHGREGS